MIVRDLGRMEYRAAWDEQLRVHAEVEAGGPDTLLFVEHDPVLTLGMAHKPENLLFPVAEYEARGFQVVPNDRGGDVTYHGPGQLTIYPIFDLRRHGKDLHRWLRDLEEVVIVAARHWGIEARRFPPHTGIWAGEEKFCALGIKVRRWINLHGLALNCDNDLAPFDLIVPCGIQGYGVSNLTQLAGREIMVDEAKDVVADAFAEVFTKAPEPA